MVIGRRMRMIEAMTRTDKKGVRMGPLSDLVYLAMSKMTGLPNRTLDRKNMIALFDRQKPGLIERRKGGCMVVRWKPFAAWAKRNVFGLMESKRRQTAWTPPPMTMSEHERDEFLDTQVQNLGLPLRTARALASGGMKTVFQLVHKSQKDLLGIKGIGPESVEKIREMLAEEDMHLAGDPM